MRIVRNLLLGLALGAVTVTITTPAAEAGKKAAPAPAPAADPFAGVPDIKPCSIAEFDAVYNEAGGIQVDLKGAWKQVVDARGNVNTVLGVAADAPVKTALEDLKGKAAGKVKVALEGGKPRLQPSEAVPENVQQGLDAVNALVDAGQATASRAVGIKDKVMALGSQAAGFPMKVPGMLGNLTPDQAKTAPKIVGDNTKAIKEMPKQIDAISAQVEGIFTDIKGVFGA